MDGVDRGAVVSLGGGPVGLAGEVDEVMVARLEQMLALAKEGALSSMGVVAMKHDRELATTFAVGPTGSYVELLGAVSYLGHQVRCDYDAVE